MRTLAIRATRAKHVNVLQHIMGFFKRELGAADKRELLGLIGDYARGLVPLIVPITLINLRPWCATALLSAPCTLYELQGSSRRTTAVQWQ